MLNANDTTIATTEIRRVGLEFDVIGFIDGCEEFIGCRRSETAAEQLAASWRLEQAELASAVYARPAEPDSEPVFVEGDAENATATESTVKRRPTYRVQGSLLCTPIRDCNDVANAPHDEIKIDTTFVADTPQTAAWAVGHNTTIGPAYGTWVWREVTVTIEQAA